MSNFNILERATDPAEQAKFASKTAQDIVKGVGSVGTTKEVIAVLKQQTRGDERPGPAPRPSAGPRPRRAQAAGPRVDRRAEGRGHQDRQEQRVGRPEGDRTLQAIQERLIAHGDTAAARIVGALINCVIPAINNIRIVNGTTLPGVLPPGRRRPRPRAARPRRRTRQQQPDEGQNRGGTLNNVRVNVTTGWNSHTQAAVTHSPHGPDAR